MSRLAASGQLADLLRALESGSLAEAHAELDGLIRLADNAADELALLVACTADLPHSSAAEHARVAGLAAVSTADELRALRRRLEL